MSLAVRIFDFVRLNISIASECTVVICSLTVDSGNLDEIKIPRETQYTLDDELRMIACEENCRVTAALCTAALALKNTLVTCP